MSARPQLETVPGSSELHFGPRGELRETFAKTGRIHFHASFEDMSRVLSVAPKSSSERGNLTHRRVG